jgi:predicted HTH transcriptional regulator
VIDLGSHGTSDKPDSRARTLFRTILTQLLGQPVEVVENEELEIKGWCKDEKEFAEKVVESACCIANARGGVVLAGIESKRTIFSPCPYPNVSAAWIEMRVKDQSYPPVECEVFDLTEMLAEIRGKQDGNAFGLLIPKKAFLTSHVTTRGVSKIRKGRECKPYFTTADDDRTRAIDHGATTNDLSMESMKWAIARHQKKFGLPLTDENPLDFLARMRLIVSAREGVHNTSDYQVTMAALILFGKERALQRMNPSVETIVSLGNERFRVARNVVECVRELVIAEKSPLRHRCRSVSQEMLFELLMNAYIHRCWRTPGPVMVCVDDILEIQSPGELMPGLNVTNLLHCIPCYRNFLLAESSRHVGLCDKLGKGIGLIFDSALKGGLDIPIFESANNAFTVRLSLSRSENFAEFVRVRSASLSSTDEILTLRALLDRADMSVEEIAQVLQRGIEHTNSVLHSMEKKMMIESNYRARFSLAHGIRDDIKNIFHRNQLDLFQG